MQLLHLLLLVELSTLTLLLGQYLEEVCSTVTLDNCGAELSLLDSSNSTTQSGLAGTCSLYKDRSREGDLANAVNNSTLLLGCSDVFDTCR